MLGRARRNKVTGWVAAWAAAYALVFQLVFASALVAGMPRDASGVPLCSGAASLALDASHGDAGEQGQVHCPACLARVDVTDLPPPVGVPAPVRTAVAAAYVPLAPAFAARAPQRLPAQPRAPPFLG